MNRLAGAVGANGTLWRRAQTGNVQHYALVFLGGVVAVLAYYVIAMSGMEQAVPTGNVLLSLIVWTPMIGAFLVLLLPREQVDGAKRAAFAFSLLTFLLSLGALGRLLPERRRLSVPRAEAAGSPTGAFSI